VYLAVIVNSATVENGAGLPGVLRVGRKNRSPG
jgi:hypothetical protein